MVGVGLRRGPAAFSKLKRVRAGAEGARLRKRAHPVHALGMTERDEDDSR